MIGKEVGACGTPHLQGYVTSDTKFRPLEKFRSLTFKLHWEKCKGNEEQNVAYCSKGKNFVTNMEVPEPVEIDEPYGWQLKVVELVQRPRDKRTIHWFWEPKGGKGKSSLMRWLVVKQGALVCAGKAADMKYLVVKFTEQHKGVAPKVIVFDVPRSSAGYISYTGIEEIKNGVFASTKYECGMHVQNHPHVFVFANFKPEPGVEMSADRFDTYNIDEMIKAEEIPPPQPELSLKRQREPSDVERMDMLKATRKAIWDTPPAE
jgi:hypothetical protein